MPEGGPEILLFAGIFFLDSAFVCRGLLHQYTCIFPDLYGRFGIECQNPVPHHLGGRRQLQGPSEPGGRGKVASSIRLAPCNRSQCEPPGQEGRFDVIACGDTLVGCCASEGTAGQDPAIRESARVCRVAVGLRLPK
jgi:hypothetical protein